MNNATLLVCVGKFGEHVRMGIEEEAHAGAAQGEDNLRFISVCFESAERRREDDLLPLGPQGRLDVGSVVERCAGEATELLKLGRRIRDASAETSGPPQLDILFAAHMACPASRALLLPFVQQMNAVLRQRFAGIFPRHRGPANFNVTIVPVLAGPLLAAEPRLGASIRDDLLSLENWQRRAGDEGRIVSRAYFVQEQTSGYVLEPEDLTAMVVTFLTFLFFASARDDEDTRRFFRSSSARGFWSTFACASLGFPSREAHQYCGNRLAIALLEGLSETARTVSPDAQFQGVSRSLWFAEEHLGDLDLRKHLRQMRVRFSASFGEANEALGEVGFWEDPVPMARRFDERWLRERLDKALASRGAADDPRKALPVLDALKVDEEGILQDREEALRRFIDRAVSPERNVEQLASCIATLEEVERSVSKDALKEERVLEEPLPAPPSRDKVEGRFRDFHETLGRKPDTRRMLLWGAVVGIFLGILFAVWPPVLFDLVDASERESQGSGLLRQVASPAQAQEPGFAERLFLGAPYAVTIPVGLLLAFGILLVRNRYIVKEIRGYLGTPGKSGLLRDELLAFATGRESNEDDFEGGSEDRMRRAVAAARLRICRTYASSIASELSGLRDIQHAIEFQIESFRRRQQALNVVESSHGEDDVSRVFPDEHVLRWSLLSASCLPALYEAKRSTREMRVLRENVLRLLWTEDWRDRTPFSNTGILSSFVEEQYEALLKEGPFDWSEHQATVSRRVVDFLRSLGGRLEFSLGSEGLAHLAEHGSTGESVDETVVTGRRSKVVVERAIEESDIGRWQVTVTAAESGKVHLVRAQLGIPTETIGAFRF